MVSNTIGNSGKIYVAAAMMPFAMVSVDDAPLLGYALAHKTVNAGYTKTASNDDVYMGLMNASTERSRSGDPYTSAEQKQRDLYEINDTDWSSVRFEQVGGTSVCHLALHTGWIQSRGYTVDAIVDMNLSEQGISGPFRITSIKHILPQKKPESDPGDGYEWKPVTGLFIHHSDQVHNISFNNNETIGVTAPHPIFSTTHNDWRLAGELEVGEQILTYHGEATVASNEKKAGSEVVYNLEVKDLHNFLVGERGVVVHNSYLNEFLKLFGNWKKRKHSQWLDYAEESGLPSAKEIKQFQDLGGKTGKRFLGLGKSTRTNSDFPGIDGFDAYGKGVSLKKAESATSGGDLMSEMVNKANNLNDGLVQGHTDMAGMFNKIDGMLTANLSTKHWLKQRWTDRLNNPDLKTDIIDKLYVEAKDGWMVWDSKTGLWTDL